MLPPSWCTTALIQARSSLGSSCACHAAGGCKVNVHRWETWTLPRLIPVCTELLKPCVSAKSCSAIALKKWPQPAIMPCSRGAVALQCYSIIANADTGLGLPTAITLAITLACFSSFGGSGKSEYCSMRHHLMRISMQAPAVKKIL